MWVSYAVLSPPLGDIVLTLCSGIIPARSAIEKLRSRVNPPLEN